MKKRTTSPRKSAKKTTRKKATPGAKAKATNPTPAPRGRWLKAKRVRVRKERGRLVLDIQR